ncbi:ABC transporter permease [Natrarchaeobaculum sulfurireducens]|uniref:ABC-type dipeptide/oligopeptide/nickel transportsystem, permease component n=1 Tax=Natrarchaeobaculum sulfurireducens TaxID=2044521 RepID=A0A346PKQ4_9EURY|nr:ABC transporter permease [Natrarchaeobaculum sulfurireducens]AXR76422.1 ABC-type dipeptide/oligopeptide/nickel transportsystem, permease component [Natrarchaeobaculum sulfurireducens]AXR80099.1 Dipeptide transport system permease protein DppB [Natrarchaeobaculum sulfurireducens]
MGLLRYTLYRFLQSIPVLIGITIITFLLANLAPGDPVRLMLAGQEVDEELIETIEQRYGLDRPLHERYVTYMAGLVQGDFGHSIHRNRPVTELMLNRVGPTLLLVLSAYAFALVTAIPLGILAATRRNEPTDHISRIVALIGVSTPSFWIGIMLILVFAVQLGWLPSTGLVYPWRGPDGYDWIETWPELIYQTIRHLLLPMVALGTLQMATLMRVERTQMIESLQGEYVKLARAYGVPERTILRKHAFQVAQLPIITIVGLNLSTALGGAVLIETVFNINGMGRLFIEAIQQLDYQLIMGITIVIATMFVIGVIITDIAYAYIDPRVTYGEGE